ncbi:MAG: hypothetical protein KDD94_07740, partial [Calditrichaeota bacterium]|nr:hypothetical protein [Calditrichota bacterium]
MKKNFTILIWIYVLCSQQLLVKGVVVSGDHFVEGAKVFISDSVNTFTDQNGEFSIAFKSTAGMIRYTVTHLNYFELTDSVKKKKEII